MLPQLKGFSINLENIFSGASDNCTNMKNIENKGNKINRSYFKESSYYLV